MAIKLSPVSAQVELLSQGILNFTLVRLAPQGGALTSIASYQVLLSAPGVASITFTLTPGLTSQESTIHRQMLWADIVPIASSNPVFNLSTPGLAINIRAISGDPTNFTTSDWWPTDRLFPPPFVISSASPIIARGSVVTFTLPSGYSTNYLSRIMFSPNISEPLESTEWKSFIPGIEFDYAFESVGTIQSSISISSDIQSSTTGSSFLIQKSFITTTVMAEVPFPQTGVNSWLGVGSSTGFSFTDTSASTYTPGNFAVILTGAAISSRNKEVKMFLATSRSSDANTFYQTLAWDLYPVPGRYRVPSFNPSVNITYDATRSYTDASLYAPLKLASMALPQLQVGYDYDISLDTRGGLRPYAYYASNLPPGLRCTSDGHLIGSPTVNGLYQAAISVVDSEIPPQVDVKTLNLYVETDLTILPTVFQQYHVGEDVLTKISIKGGVAPYQWQLNVGGQDLLNYGLVFTADQGFATITGTPSDTGLNHLPYNFVVTVQAEDAMGSVAYTTIQCGVFAPMLHIQKTSLDEFFDGEYCEQRLYATGGDSTNYNWSLTWLDGPRDYNNNILTPPTGVINLTPQGTPGAPNIGVLSFNPTSVIRTTNSDGIPEQYYRVRITVQSGVAGFTETDYHDFDLIISPFLSDVVILNDAQLPFCIPGDTTWAVQLTPYTPNIAILSDGRYAAPSFFTPESPAPLALPAYLTMNSSTGLIRPHPFNNIPENTSVWFRVFVRAGRLAFFKDFHFQSGALAGPTGFSIHCDESYPNSNSNIVAIGQQFKTLCLQTNNTCIAFKVVNSSIKQVVNNVATFSLTAGTLPAGVAFSSLGFISGVPTESGAFNATVTAQVGTTSVTYPITLMVNPAAAFATDLTHDLRLVLNRPAIAGITNPLSGHTYTYGTSLQTGITLDDPNDPQFSEDTYTFAWDLSSLVNHTDQDATGHSTTINTDTTSRTPSITLLNDSRVIQEKTISFVATDNVGVVSNTAPVSFYVDTAPMRTASYHYITTGIEASDESRTDGIPLGQTNSTTIDLLGS